MLGLCRSGESSSDSESGDSGSADRAGRCRRCGRCRCCHEAGSDSDAESGCSASELEDSLASAPASTPRRRQLAAAAPLAGGFQPPPPRATPPGACTPIVRQSGLPPPVSSSSAADVVGTSTLRIPEEGQALTSPQAAAGATWSLDQTQYLGHEGCEASFEGVQLLDRSRYGSVTEAVEALNRGVAAEAGFCVVFSQSQRAYFLLWQEGMEEAALSSIADGSEEQSGPEEALDMPFGVANGCGCEYDVSEAVARGALRQDDNVFDLYAAPSRGLWGLLGLASKRKTIYCHHFTSKTKGGMFAVRAAKDAERHFRSAEDIWAFLGKSPCCGHFHPDGASENSFTCSPVSAGEHDDSCSPDTCLFLAHYLPCPVPKSAHR